MFTGRFRTKLVRFGFSLALLSIVSALAGLAAGRRDRPLARKQIEPPVVEDRWFAVEPKVGEPRLAPTVDGWIDVDLDADGFRKGLLEAGRPDLPAKLYKIAIPFDATPRLEVRYGMPQRLPAVRPRPVPRVEIEAPARDGRDGGMPLVGALRPDSRNVYEESADVYAGVRLFPSEIVTLGEIGVMRDQRYVEVRVVPMRYDARGEELVWYPELEFKVHFDGAPRTSAEPATDRFFEAAYRQSFENYEQGRRFRRDVSAAPSGPIESFVTSGGPTPRYRITIHEDGIVRIGFTELQAAGFDSHPWARLLLENNEVQMPMHIADDGDNVIESGEFLQFYAEAADREAKTENFGTDRYFARDFTDENYYFLSVAGADQPEMSERSVLPSNGAVESSFRESARFEADEIFRPLGGVDPWVALPLIEELEFRDIVFPMTGLSSSTAPIDVRVEVRGRSTCPEVDPDHLTRVTLENSTSDVLATDDIATDGESMYQHVFTWTHSGGAGATDPMTVRLEALDVPAICASGGGGQTRNDVYLNWAEIDYERSFIADGDFLEFDWPDGNAEFEITGFDTSPEVYEITGRFSGTDVVDAERLTDVQVTAGANFTARFEITQDPNIPDGSPRRFVAYGANAVQTPSGADLTLDTVSTLRNTANQADWLVIAHPDVLDQGPAACTGLTPTGCLTELITHRQSPAGGGLTTMVANVQDVYDEFFGGQPSPLAIREFLRWVMSTEIGEGWASPKPSFVLLLGDGSYDYKSGTTFGNLIPTQIVLNLEPELQYYATDTYMAAVVGGDFTPDLMLGRIPVRTTGEANTVLRKILEYETNTPTGTWRQRFLAVADHGHGIENPQFPQTNDDSFDLATDPGYLSTRYDYWNDYSMGTDKEGIRQDIKDVVNGMDPQADGTSIVQYVGHGNFQVWSDDAFWDERKATPDATELLNGFKLPVMLAHNCLTGGFHFTFRDILKIDRTVAEGWLKQDAGGAVAVWSPTGLSFNFISDQGANTFWDTTFGAPKERVLGVSVMAALDDLCTGTQSLDACLFYSLQGDPATVMKLPTVGKPGDPQIVSGNSVVDLSWTASTGSTNPGTIEYDVYRASLLGGAYSKLTGPGHTATTYMDSSAVNGQVYYYYIVARDPLGFESAWSNFNSDCPSGPDCLEGTPLNPNPPVIPTGLAVADPGNGTSLDVTWDVNPEPDIDFYTVEYGTSSGIYTFDVDVGANQATIDALTSEQLYYIVVSATNTSGLTSPTSGEVSSQAFFAPGLAIPDFVDDLTVRYDFPADDAILEWTDAGRNVWGQSSATLRYDIYRGTDADFSVGGLTLLNSCNAPCNSYTDVDAVSSPSNYHYRVQVVDTVGELSGLGSELPASILDLVTSPSVTPGDVKLEWSAVTETLDGTPTEIDHYLVYYSATEFNREDIENMVGGILGPVMTTATTLELTPPGAESYYSVLAVDVRGQVSPF